MELDTHQTDNRANWNDRAPIHARSATYGLQRFVDDPEHISRVIDFDRSRLGELSGLRVAHLQCHIGTDTISLKRLGARSVVGLDFADAAIDIARQLAVDAATPTDFVVGNVYDAAC